MSILQERIAIVCPLSQANLRLHAFFKKHGNPDGDVAKLVLRLDILDIGEGEAFGLQRAVIATIQSQHDAEAMTPGYLIQWAPEHPGPFPIFAGTLHVLSDEDYEHFTLELHGEYAPPLGVLGQGFDMVVGKHIAHRTAMELLGTIKRSIEEDYLTAEQHKTSIL